MAPFKKITKKEIGLQQRPWISPDIIAAINERNKLYKEFSKKQILTKKMINTTYIKQNVTILLIDCERLKNIIIMTFFKQTKTRDF